MKALSLWQPWASLLVHGKKCVETRGWSISHRGPLLIHAAKRLDDEQGEICHREPFRSALESLGMLTVSAPTPEVAGPLTEFVGEQTVLKVVLGAIVGRVEVVDCFPTTTTVLGSSIGEDEYHKGRLIITRTEEAFGDYSPGRFAFLCRNPVAFAKPIPFPGKQGLFDFPDNLLPKDV